MSVLRPLFRYNSLDGLLALSTVGIVALLFAMFFCFDRPVLNWRSPSRINDARLLK